MDQHLKFLAPVHPGDIVHATVTERGVIADRGRMVLHTTCSVRGVAGIDGEALVKVESSARRAAKERLAYADQWVCAQTGFGADGAVSH